MSNPRWSVVIPAYNEEKRLPPYLREIVAYYDSRRESYEVVVVDDGSQDDTAAVIGRLQQSCPTLQLVRLPHNRGKGHAVRTGMLAARGELRLFVDADGATPIQEVKRLEERIAGGVDVAIGSRRLPDPTCTVDTDWQRRFSRWLFNRIVRCLGMVRGIADTQCGCKLFRAQAAMDLFSVAQLDRYSFDIELLFVAQRRGYRIAEVPISWTNQAGSKVHVLRDGLLMLCETWAIRKNYLRGRYVPREVVSSRS